MKKVKIEKGIPIPGKCVGGHPEYPWLEMKVGDSFLHRSDKPSSVSGQASMAGNRYRRKFCTRKTTKGYRIWRTK